MKTLRESILDDDDDIIITSTQNIDFRDISKELSKYYLPWIPNNDKIRNRLEGNALRNVSKIHKVGNSNILDLKCNVDFWPYSIEGEYIELHNANIFQFGTIDGDFKLNIEYEGTNLQNTPRIIKGNFECVRCRKLRFLFGGPIEVGGLNLDGCLNLTFLRDCPKKINGDINLNWCQELRYITDLNKSNITNCNKIILKYCKKLQNLTGLENIKKLKLLDLSRCECIKKLNDLPMDLFDASDSTIKIRYCKRLQTLDGIPNVKKIELAACDNITSLNGLHEDVQSLTLDRCKHLTDISFIRNMNNLKTLKIVQPRNLKYNKAELLKEYPNLKNTKITIL